MLPWSRGVGAIGILGSTPYSTIPVRYHCTGLLKTIILDVEVTIFMYLEYLDFVSLQKKKVVRGQLEPVMGGAASRGKKQAAEQRDAGLKRQGQSSRNEDSAALLPSHPATRMDTRSVPAIAVSQLPQGSGRGSTGRAAAKPWGNKPATPQEFALAGLCARTHNRGFLACWSLSGSSKWAGRGDGKPEKMIGPWTACPRLGCHRPTPASAGQGALSASRGHAMLPSALLLVALFSWLRPAPGLKEPAQANLEKQVTTLNVSPRRTVARPGAESWRNKHQR